MAEGIVEELIRRATAVCPSIVYPEPEDPRIAEAAARVARMGVARPVLVGRGEALPSDRPAGVAVRCVEDSHLLDEFAAAYAARRGIKESVARRIVQKPLAFGAMMVALGHADGMVGGISHATASLLQAAGLTIGYGKGIAAPSSCFIMVVPRLEERQDVPLIFADCAVNIEPTAEQLAGIALASAESARKFLGVLPRVAMLSFSTEGSASHRKVDLVREAARLAASRIRDGFVQGELQLDAALVPRVAQKKVKEPGEVAGRANVLVFPDLNAGNIAYKAVQYLGGAQAIGPILQGFAKPVNDLSRGASVEDVIAITAVTALQV
jgi:phosphate acetyltransferase